MKKLLIYGLLLLLSYAASAQQTVDIGLFKKDSTTLEVRLLPSFDFSEVVTGMVVTIKYKVVHGSDLGNPAIQTPAIAIFKAKPRVQVGNYYYQTLTANSLSKLKDHGDSLTAQQEFVIATIPVVNPIDSFELIVDSWTDKLENNGSYFVSANGFDVTGTIYKPVVLFCNPIQIHADVNPPICIDQNDGSIFTNASGGIPPFQYNWSNGSPNDSLYFLPPGSYSLTITDDIGCFSTWSDSVSAVSTLEKPELIQSDDTLSVVARGTIQWYYNGSPVPGATGSSFVTTANGDYYVEVSDSLGCQTSSDIVSITSTGIEFLGDQLGWSLYPNPTSALIMCKFEASQGIDLSVELFDTKGEYIYHEHLDLAGGETIKIFDLSNHSSGVYFVRVSTPSATFTKKFILQK